MKKFLPALTFLLVLTATPVIAAQNNNSQSECDPNANWKNHGQYVSCVAHEHPGGAAVSEAARSNVGKKNAVESPAVSPSPGVSPSPPTNPIPQLNPSP